MNKQKKYDLTSRNQEAKKFYNSSKWKYTREVIMQRDFRLCQRCLKEGIHKPADVVHHKVELLDDWSLALEHSNLESICHLHHTLIHKSTKDDDGIGLECSFDDEGNVIFK